MMRRRLAALVVVLAAGVAIAGVGSGSIGGSSVMGRLTGIAETIGVATAADPYAAATLQFDYKPFSVGHTLPACTAANNCAMQCTAYSTGNAWRCVDGSGSSFTVTQGTASVVTTPWGTSALNIWSDANAPSIATANLGTLATTFTGAHTIVVTGVTGSNAGAYFPFAFQNGTTGYMLVRPEGSNQKCVWGNVGGTGGEVTVIADAGGGGGMTMYEGWSMVACRKTGLAGASSYNSRINGTNKETAWAFDPGSMAAGTIRFGRHSSAGLYMHGMLESVTVFSEAKSDATLTTYEDAWTGNAVATSQTTSPLTHTHGTTSSGRDFIVDPDGYYTPVGRNVPRVLSSGMRVAENSSGSRGGSGSNWATDNTAAASWTAVGTPTTTSNTSSGPFSRWPNTAEADLIVDDDAGALEGYTAVTSAGTTLTKYTASCFLAPGTTGVTTDKARLAITTDGTGSTTCDKTVTAGSLAGGFARYTCTATVTGSPTFVRGQVLVGNATTDTGSILVSQCQVDKKGWADQPRYTNTAIGIDLTNVSNAEVDAWAHTTSGSYQVVFTPDFTWATDIYDSEDTYEPLDIYSNGAADHRALGWQYYNTNPAIATRGSGGATTTTDTYASSDPSVVAGHNYAFRIKWAQHGVGFVDQYIYFNECAGSVATCYADTLIGSDTTGTKVAPTTGDWGGWYIGCRYSQTLCMEGQILRATVWSQ